MQKTHPLIYLIIFFLMSTIFRIAVINGQHVHYDFDEISEYFDTVYFDEFFIHHRPFSPMWYTFENYHGPTLSKYMYGAYLYGLDRTYAQKRDALIARDGRWTAYEQFLSGKPISDTPYAHAIQTMRQLNVYTLFVIFCGLYMLMYFFSRSLWYPLIFCLALAVNPVFIEAVTVATRHNFMLLFGLGTILLYLYFVFRKNSTAALIITGICTALCISTKLNGVFIFTAIVIHQCTHIISDWQHWRYFLSRTVLYVCVVFICWIIINPALYVSPLKNTITYFSLRVVMSKGIGEGRSQHALRTPGERLRATWCTLVVRICPEGYTSGTITPYYTLNYFLALCFIISLWRALQKKRNEQLFLLLIGGIMVAAYLLFLHNYFAVYFVFIQVLLFLFQLLGLQEVFRMIGSITRYTKKFTYIGQTN